LYHTIFSILGPNLRLESRVYLEDFEKNLTKDDAGNYVITDEQLRFLVKAAEYFSSEGVPMTDLMDGKCPNLWTFSGAAYFCGTIVTTVGYGDTAPKTFEGRIAFMLFVIPGIAICGALLAEIGVLIFNFTNRTKNSLQNAFHHRPYVIPLFWLAYTLFFLGIFLFVPAAIIFSFKHGDWSFFESIYFMMVTFSTVGFGDFTITETDMKFIILAFNYMGLAWVGVIAGVITEKIQRMNKVAQYAHTAQVLSKSQSKKDLECSGLSDNEQSADF